jgi:hypothetical protein
MATKKKSGDGVDVDSFNKTVHLLLELLGRDMESNNPSRDKDLLVIIREGLFRVEIAGQLFGYIKSFRELLVKNYPECSRVSLDKKKHIKLTMDVAKLSVQSFTGKSQIYTLLKELGVDMDDTQMAIFAITQFMEMIRRLPIKFFSDPDTRLKILNTMQYELDVLVAKEEEESEEIVEGVND